MERPRAGLKTIASLLRAGLGLSTVAGEWCRCADEDDVLEAYADRLAVTLDWLRREYAWESPLRTLLAMLEAR